MNCGYNMRVLSYHGKMTSGAFGELSKGTEILDDIDLYLYRVTLKEIIQFLDIDPKIYKCYYRTYQYFI